MSKKYLVVASLLMGLSTAFAASFDCASASHAVERMICASGELNRLDEEMAIGYKEALKEPSGADGVKLAQTEWIKETRKCADESCLQRLYQERLKILLEVVSAASRNGGNASSSTDKPAVDTPKVVESPARVPQSIDAQPSAGRDKQASGSGVGIYLIALVVLGLIGFLLKKLLGIGKKSPGGEATPSAAELPQQPVQAVAPIQPIQESQMSESPPFPEMAVDHTESASGVHVIAMGPNTKNIEKFHEVMTAIGCNNFLGWYFTQDPRHEAGVVDGLADIWGSCLAENREDKFKAIEHCIREFLAQPDIYSLWRYSLLIKYANDDSQCNWSADAPNQWSLLESVGGTVENCLEMMQEVKALFLSEQITSSDHDDAMKSLVLCYLACAFSEEDTYAKLTRLMNLIGQNSYINDFEFENGVEGVGELLFACRRVVEELTEVRVDAPEGVDLEQDGYLDYVDWDEVATQIYERLA